MRSNCDILTKIDLDPLYHNSPRVFIYLLASGYKSRRASYIRSNFRFESRSKVQLPFRHRSLRSARRKVSGINDIEFVGELARVSLFSPSIYALHRILASRKRRRELVFRSSEKRAKSEMLPR